MIFTASVNAGIRFPLYFLRNTNVTAMDAKQEESGQPVLTCCVRIAGGNIRLTIALMAGGNKS